MVRSTQTEAPIIKREMKVMGYKPKERDAKVNLESGLGRGGRNLTSSRKMPTNLRLIGEIGAWGSRADLVVRKRRRMVGFQNGKQKHRMQKRREKPAFVT